MAVPTVVSSGSYTWTFPGCPIRIRLRIEVVDALERLIAQLEASATLAPLAGGLLLGDTATPGVTEIAAMQPLPALDPGGVEAAVGMSECEVVGFFRAERGNPMQPGASLQMTEDDIALAAGLFRQPSSVVLLIERLEAEKPKAAFFFWDGGKMLGDFLSWTSRLIRINWRRWSGRGPRRAAARKSTRNLRSKGSKPRGAARAAIG